jgi:hypothetical protein
MKIQRDGSSCGPIAIINAYKNINNKYPTISIKRLRRLCKTNNNYGTFRWNISNTSLINIDKPIYKIGSIMNLDRFILLYSFGKYSQHYVYVVRTRGLYKIYNYCSNDTIGYSHITMNRREFHNLLRGNPRCVMDLDYPLAWSIN